MARLSEIEKAISELSTTDFQKFRQWFFQFDNERWDAKIEKDVADNRLSFLAEEALKDYKAGKSTEI